MDFNTWTEPRTEIIIFSKACPRLPPSFHDPPTAVAYMPCSLSTAVFTPATLPLIYIKKWVAFPAGDTGVDTKHFSAAVSQLFWNSTKAESQKYMDTILSYVYKVTMSLMAVLMSVLKIPLYYILSCLTGYMFKCFCIMLGL